MNASKRDAAEAVGEARASRSPATSDTATSDAIPCARGFQQRRRRAAHLHCALRELRDHREAGVELDRASREVDAAFPQGQARRMRFAPSFAWSRTHTGYDAFISYSHEADERIAASMRSALHRFAKPWYMPRALRIFLDRASLSATPDLWDGVRRQLDGSRFLILLASPEAARSQWVGPRELVH